MSLSNISLQERAADKNISEFFDEIQDELFPPVEQSKLMKLLNKVFKSPVQRRKRMRRAYSKFERFLNSMNKSALQDEKENQAGRINGVLKGIRSRTCQTSQNEQMYTMPNERNNSRFPTLNETLEEPADQKYLSVQSNWLPSPKHMGLRGSKFASPKQKTHFQNSTLNQINMNRKKPRSSVKQSLGLIVGKRKSIKRKKNAQKRKHRISIKVGGPRKVRKKRPAFKDKYSIRVEKNELRSILHETLKSSPIRKREARASLLLASGSSYPKLSGGSSKKKKKSSMRKGKPRYWFDESGIYGIVKNGCMGRYFFLELIF